ncbi:MAG: hypothetical protein GQ582_07325 [Methyloprofundus sp.]|nr:hypothetical protein [Methyloprofundus sp.]
MKRSTLFICSTLCAFSAQAEDLSSSAEEVDYTPTLEQWQRTAQNPLSPNFSLPFRYTFHGDAPAGDVHIGSFSPVIPIKFDGWNIINKLTLNIMGTPGDITGIKGLPQPYTGDGHGGSDGYATGLADMDFTSYFSSTIGENVTYGLGATFTFPTDEPSRELGSGQVSMGPAAMIVYQPNNWTFGLEVQQIWSVIGSSGRDDVSQMVLQPSIYYNLPEGWYLLSDMQMVTNWNSRTSQQWTVPVGGGVGKLFKTGKHAVDIRLESYYNAITPTEAPNWSVGASVNFIFGEL